jgi:hypothetical protein
MNRIVGKKPDGSSFLVLILEPGNVHSLQHKDPILIRLADHFPHGMPADLELVIGYSETPVADNRPLSRMAKAGVDGRVLLVATRPHCPECRSTIEQIGVMTSDQWPIDVYFCRTCGCTLNIVRKVGETRRADPS